jgi:two-component system, chemotaxis family, chemotaxis protein CheY
VRQEKSSGNGVVLIVEDDDAIRETLELALGVEQYPTAVARDGQEALDWLLGHDPPSLILLDLMMPVMDGWQLLDHLRRDSRLAQVPVVVTTAFGRDLKSAAALPILRKPIELKDLFDVVGCYASAGT